jgi:hypothetical protein
MFRILFRTRALVTVALKNERLRIAGAIADHSRQRNHEGVTLRRDRFTIAWRKKFILLILRWSVRRLLACLMR